jgi:starch-binding outer membrane protein, SusD/RagB family
MNYRIFAFLLAGVLLVTGCVKSLDLEPPTSATELKNFNDIRNALRGAYDGFQSTNYYNAGSGTPSAWGALPDLMGDDFVEAFESLGNWRNMAEHTYAQDNGLIEGAWFQAYEIISRVNNILNFIGNYESGSTANEARQIRAQCYAIRAHAHFDLMRYFAQTYTRGSDSLGVPYVTRFDYASNPNSFLPSRQTVKQNYDSVYNDLSRSLALFRQAGMQANASRNTIDSIGVYAMRARINLYAKDYAGAENDASVVIALRPLANAATYPSLWVATNPSLTEVIWEIPSDQTLRPGSPIGGVNPSYRVSNALAQTINAQGGAYVATSVIRFNQTGIGGVNRTIFWKYPGIRAFKVYRTGEMVLIRAEARYFLNKPVDALADLNLLRTNRGVATGTETGVALYNAIMLQRRVELIGEGHRWFDIKRTTRTINRTECGTANGSLSNICTVAPNSRAWIWPIPFNDIKVNRNLVQNPGY